MKNWFDERISFIKSLESYEPAVPNRKDSSIKIKLDANENWNIPVERMREFLISALSEFDPRSYPDASVNMLREAISKNLNLSEKCIVPCSGSDQAIDLICQSFLRPKDKVIVVSPTFSMYGLRSAVAGAQIYNIVMEERFKLPVNNIISNSRSEGIVFICSPNNPTGNQFEKSEIIELLDSFSGLVVVDEAYVEFADFSLYELVKKYNNLAILRTFSKAFGLAGLRLGYIVGSEEWAEDFLYKAQYPYAINGLVSIVAKKLLDNYDGVKRWIKKVKEEREWLVKNLSYINGIYPFDSKTNFVMISMDKDSSRVHSKLLSLGISTRDLGMILNYQNCLRVTVGTREMNKLLVEGLGR